MNSTIKCAICAVIYVVILVFVMLFVNLFFHSENIETEIAVAIPAAFIAFCAGK